MTKLNDSLKALADKENTKTGWTGVVQQGLGNNRRLRAFRDPNANAADPAATGVEFLNLASTGPLGVKSGDIADFGLLSDATVRKAADLSSGTCILRLEGQGNSITYTLGLPGSNKDFVLSRNPTGSVDEGYAFTRNAGTKAPVLLDSGTGPLSPPMKDNMVVAFQHEDWSSGSMGAVSAVCYLSQREPNMVMEHAWMAREYGDVRIMRVPDGQGIVVGTGGDCYLFAAENMIANPVINGEASEPLQQFEGRAVPFGGRWANYPFRGNFNLAYDTMVPAAFKLRLLNKDLQIVDYIEDLSTRDANNTPGSGKAVNDITFSDVAWTPTPGTDSPTIDFGKHVVRRWWDCSQVLAWWSHKPKALSIMNHLVPPVEDDALHESNVAERKAYTDYNPLRYNNFEWKNQNNWKIAPKWGRKWGDGFDTTIIDPYFYDPLSDAGGSQLIGYGYTPGQPGCHTQYTPPGGSRSDRSGWAHATIKWVSDPNGIRPHGAVPLREMFHHWTLNYFNHSCHWFADVYRGHGVDKKLVLAREVFFNDCYYSNGREDQRKPVETKAVRLLSIGNTHHGWFYADKNGKRFTGEWNRDIEHNNANAAVAAYTTISPRHVREARHSLTAAIMASFDVNQSFDPKQYLTRYHNWYNWNLVNYWIVANNHPDSFTSLDMERLLGEHWEQVHTAVMAEYNNPNSYYGNTMKILGMPCTAESDFVTVTCTPLTDSKAFYFAQTFLLMKQCGLYDRMIKWSPKVKAIMELTLATLTKYATDVFLDCNGRMDKYFTDNFAYMPKFTFPHGQGAVYPTSWNDMAPPLGQIDWVHSLQNGGLRDDKNDIDGQNTMHFRAQWLMMVKHYYPEYTFPRLDAAITKMRGYYQIVKDTPGVQFSFRFAMMGLFKAPDYVGAPV